MALATTIIGGTAMGRYSHLSIEEREDVMLLARQHKGVGEIARTIGRGRPAVSRELARNPSAACAAPCCRASIAQHKHERGRGRCHGGRRSFRGSGATSTREALRR